MPLWPQFWLPSGHAGKNWNSLSVDFLLQFLTAFQNMPAFFFFLIPGALKALYFSSTIYRCYLWEDKLLHSHSIFKAELCTLFPTLGGG